MNFLAVVTETTGISIGVLGIVATAVITLVGGGFKLFYELGQEKQRGRQHEEDIKEIRTEHDDTKSRIVTVLERLTDGFHGLDTRVQILEHGQCRKSKPGE